MKKRIILWVLCAASFVCAVVCGVRFNALHMLYQSDQNYAFVTVNQSEYRDIEEETYVVGTYLEEDGKVAEAVSVKRSSEASLIAVDFTLSGLFGAGVELKEGDADGCILSNALCYALFGTETVSGQQVMVEQKTYTVRGVFESEDFMMVVQQEQDVSGIWAQAASRQASGVLLDVSGESYRGQYAAMFAGRHGIEDEDYYYARDYLKLFPGITLPSKWSDFDSWKTVIEEWQVMSERRLYQNKDSIEIFCYRLRQEFVSAGRSLAIASLFCIFFFIWNMTSYKRHKITDSSLPDERQNAVRKKYRFNFRRFSLRGNEASDPESSCESGNSSE